MNFSAVILAGGKSSRMGRDKARLEVGGQPWLARQVQLARESGATEVFISGRADTDYAAFGCRVLGDKFAGAGPLAGIERALEVVSSSRLLVLAVDLPAMNAELLRWLGADGGESLGAIPRLNGNIEPLAAFYPKTAWKTAAGLMETCWPVERRARTRHVAPPLHFHAGSETGTPSVKCFAEYCVESGLARFVELPVDEARCFANWNSPVDLPCLT